MEKKTSKLSMASLIVLIIAILSLIIGYMIRTSDTSYLFGFIYFLAKIISVILAIISLFLIHRYKLKGKSYAIITIVLAAVIWLGNYLLSYLRLS